MDKRNIGLITVVVTLIICLGSLGEIAHAIEPRYATEPNINNVFYNADLTILGSSAFVMGQPFTIDVEVDNLGSVDWRGDYPNNNEIYLKVDATLILKANVGEVFIEDLICTGNRLDQEDYIEHRTGSTTFHLVIPTGRGQEINENVIAVSLSFQMTKNGKQDFGGIIGISAILGESPVPLTGGTAPVEKKIPR